MKRTIGQAQSEAFASLQGTSKTPDLDAAWLLQSIVRCNEPSWLISHADTLLTESQGQQLAHLLHRRQQGEPVAYLLGEAGFYGRIFAVTPDVLIPRPETENLVDEARRVLRELSEIRGRPLRVADIGTGSGCIAITLALEEPDAISSIIATDISRPALTVARRNAARLGVSDITWKHGSMMEPIESEAIDLIVSNPPYVPSSELRVAAQDPATRGLLFEPTNALDGGEDGMTYVNQIRRHGVPAVIEQQGGEIVRLNYPQSSPQEHQR